MREGDVVYRSGEVIYAGVLSSKLADAENTKQLEMFLSAANEAAMQRMGIRSEEPVGVLWLPNELIQAALKRNSGGRRQCVCKAARRGKHYSR